MLLLCPDVCQNTSIASGDFNGDRRWDVVLTGGTTGVYMGGPAPGHIWFQEYAPRILDLDGDGYSDLVAYSNASAWLDFAGRPGGLSPSSGEPIASQPVLPQAADFNGDGSWDAVDVTGGTIWYGGVGQTQRFATSAPLPALAPGVRVVDEAAIDMNADGYDDLVISLEGGGLVFLAGSPTGLSSVPVVLPPP